MGFLELSPKTILLVETTPTEMFLLELTEVRRQKSQKNFTHNLKIAEKFVVFGRVARSMSLKRRHFNEKFRDEKRQKRSHCIQWERNAIFRSVPTVSRPWKNYGLTKGSTGAEKEDLPTIWRAFNSGYPSLKIF
jgi:hypothetical protein